MSRTRSRFSPTVRFTLLLICGAFGWGILCPAAHAEKFPVYPNAVRDEALAQRALDQAKRLGVAGEVAYSTAYVTPDSFASVLAFYRGVAHEYAMPGRPANHRFVLPEEIVNDRGKIAAIPSAISIRQAFFILDGAADLAQSHRWLMIAEPIVGHMGVTRPAAGRLHFTYGKLRQETAITYIEIRSRPD